MDLTYPKDYRANLAWRRELLLRAKDDAAFRLRLYELFHRDILFAFNAFFFTFDTRKRPDHHQPFCTYGYQDDAILEIDQAIREGFDLLLEKSRDMGASWMIIMVFLYHWLSPSGGADFLLGSRIQDYVDKKGDMRTLFQKARYALYKLPLWLRPSSFNIKIHDNFAKLINPETGSTITGESNNEQFSTGGRYAAVLFDEFAKWEGTDKAAWTAAGDATPSRIAISTPNGVGGQYYRLVTDPTKRKLRLHWSLHPEKALKAYCVWNNTNQKQQLQQLSSVETQNSSSPESLIRSPWYDKECARRTPREIAQELDINYLGSGNPVFTGNQYSRIETIMQNPRTPLQYLYPDLATGVFESTDNVREGENLLLVYEQPTASHTYVLGVDVVEGVEDGDFAIVKILCRETKSIAASYFSRINEVELAKIIKMCSEYYTTHEAPWTGIETNASGLSTFDFCNEVWDLPNLFTMPVYDTVKESISYKKGWRTTRSSKNVLVAGIKEWLLEARGWCDSRLCGELISFIKTDTGQMKAKQGTNDDEVMAFGIALQVDLIAPHVEAKPQAAQGTQAYTIQGRKFFPKIEEPQTLEARCFASALREIELKKQLNQFGSIDPIIESIENFGMYNYLN